MICLQKEHLKILMQKLIFFDFFDLILINKLTVCQNFYIMIKYVDEINGYSSPYSTPPTSYNDTLELTQLKIQIICEKSLESVLSNRKGNLKLDPVSYYVMLIIYNL